MSAVPIFSLAKRRLELGFRERPIEPEDLVQAGVIVEDRKSLLAVNGHTEYGDLFGGMQSVSARSSRASAGRRSDSTIRQAFPARPSS